MLTRSINDLLAEVEPKLLPHQREPVRHLSGVLQVRHAIDMSDTGVGKTYVGAALAKLLQRRTLVVCPKIVRTAWEEAAAHFDDEISTINYEMVRTGRTPFGRWERPDSSLTSIEYQCENCLCKFKDPSAVSPCSAHHLGIHCVNTRTTRARPGAFLWRKGIDLIIFDEVHRCAGLKTRNAELLIGAVKQGITCLGLSATAFMTPMQMRALGYMLGLHQLDGRGGKLGFPAWMKRYGVKHDPAFGGYVWRVSKHKQLDAMAEIRSRILPQRGVRVTTKEIPGFPERQVTAELYDLPNPGEIDKLYREMGEALAALDKRQASDKDPEHPLTKLLRAREKIELLKVPVAVELAEDYIAKGCSVALFVNFSSMMAELRKRLKCDCFIDGTQIKPGERDKHIDNFQSDAAHLIVVNAKAGGIACSLHDVRGERQRIGIVFPPESARDLKQLLGRLHRAGAKSNCLYRILFAAKTVEVPVQRRLKAMLNNLDALNDGDLAPENLRTKKFDKSPALG